MVGGRNRSAPDAFMAHQVMGEDVMEPAATSLEAAATTDASGAAAVAPARFEEFFDGEHVRLSRALYLLTGNASDADELTQEAMVRVFERWDRVQWMDSPQGYLYRTALNLHRSRLRRLATRARHVVVPTPSPDPADVASGRDSLARAFAVLPKCQREALVLVEWFGMDQHEAAAIIGIRPGSLRARLSRAKADLRRMLEDEDA
jgi:RNA polymerase sigma-70 factor (ECF subfamily)